MGCCDHQIVENPAPAYQRVLWIVLAINAVMFVVEAASGVLADSRALPVSYTHLRAHET